MGKSSTQKSTFCLHSRYYLLMQVMGSLEAAMAIAKTAVRGRRRPFCQSIVIYY